MSDKQYLPLLSLNTGIIILYLITSISFLLFSILVINFLSLISQRFRYTFIVFLERVGIVFRDALVKIILIFLYFIFITPFGLIFRSKIKSFSNLKSQNKSYFSLEEKQYSIKSLERTW